MPEDTTGGQDTSVRVERDTSLQDGAVGEYRPYIRGVAAYYRLRCRLLESQIAMLAAELRRARRRHQETIARYEDILQDRPVEGCVVAPTIVED